MILLQKLPFDNVKLCIFAMCYINRIVQNQKNVVY